MEVRDQGVLGMTALAGRSDRWERLQRLSTALREAETPVRVLRTISWPGKVRERFLAGDGTALPAVDYQVPDLDPTLRRLEQIRQELGSEPEDAWLARQTDAIESGARLLQAVGTPDFLRHAQALYGCPQDPSLDGTTTVLELARHLDRVMGELAATDLGAPPPACHLASTVAAEMRSAVEARFGEEAPLVEVVDELSANALAGPRRIRIRRSACFTDLDVKQLIHHEAFIHVATSLNGRRQRRLPILGAGHPGTTRTQEGLAVFAEMASGTLDPSRLLRLAARVLAIEMAIDGADFLDVYRFFLERGRQGDREQAFESARRVFRGGVLSGGAPFTKDAVYLDGFLRVHSLLRVLVSAGRTDCLRVLFCGKLDLEDLPVLARLQSEGVCLRARYLPPWAEDVRYLVSYLGLSAFFNTVDLGHLCSHFGELLAETPRLEAVEA